MRRPTEIVQVGLRIRESLRRKLEAEARRHRVSLNNEIALRLQDSFEDLGARRSLDSITMQMGLYWTQLASDVVASRLELEVTSAVLENKDPKEIVKLLLKWLGQRQLTRRANESTEFATAAGVSGFVPSRSRGDES
jgi:hypothetical protein